MFHVLIDTSVWLDLAVDKKQSSLIHIIGNMLDPTEGDMELIVPRVVMDEFERNRDRISKKLQQSVSSQFGVVRDAIQRTQKNTKEKTKLLEYLSDQSHLTPLIGGVVDDRLEYIELMLKAAIVVEPSDAVMIRAAERALHKRAPCHHDNKNSMADAILIETYFECVKEGNPGDRFAFVTHNKSDFSSTTQWETVHPDLASGFSKIKSLYFANLSKCLMRINPEQVREVSWEMNYEEDVRSLSDILNAMERLTQQVWYNRHKNREWAVENGKIRLIPEDEWQRNHEKKGYDGSVMVDSIWKGALKAAKDTEKMLGKGNYGPWTDFEWGMINGKLSALRWALGEEWDMLDT